MAHVDPREALRQAIAAEHRLFLEADRHDQLANRWRERAELALRHGEEALARQALDRSAGEDRLARDYRAHAARHSDLIRHATRREHQPRHATAQPSTDERLNQLALEDRLERELQALKRQLNSAAGSST